MPKEFLTVIIVNQRPEFFDPKAEKLQKDIRAAGFSELKNIKIGKRFEIKNKSKDQSQAEEEASKMTEKLLVNPVTEEATTIYTSAISPQLLSPDRPY